MTQQQQGPQTRNRTTRRGTGNANRRRVTPARPQVAVDPPKPAGITYRTLDNDPTQGQAFQFQWTRGSCWGRADAIQCHVNITSPANWMRNNIVATELPVFDSVSYGGTSVRFHRLVVPQFRAFFNAVEVKGLKDRIKTQVGAYFARTITGRPTGISNHALGTAIDINAAWNGWKQPPAPRGREGSVAELADFCADFGIYWGGWYSGKKDGMHFECVRLQSETELRAACQTHGVDYDALFPPP